MPCSRGVGVEPGPVSPRWEEIPTTGGGRRGPGTQGGVVGHPKAWVGVAVRLMMMQRQPRRSLQLQENWHSLLMNQA